jgi:hypothetical protein
MDKDGSGEVSFKEFVAATLGTSNAIFSSMDEEKEASEIGVDLFVFLTRFKRHTVGFLLMAAAASCLLPAASLSM